MTKAIKKTQPAKTKKTAKHKEINNPDTKGEIPQKEPLGNTIAYRYSDEELNEFKDLIIHRLEVARKELLYLQGQMRGQDITGVEDNSDRRLSLEDTSSIIEREQMAQLASRQQQFIMNLEKALIRIENKTYGICRETGKLIDKARLRAVPHATLSIEAKKR